jgi:23S rRNA U2552 (ribose-2'-O)-methylase RlmE/FtsJ
VFKVSNVPVDIGTVRGGWVLRVADGHCTARVVGTDISPIQPVDDLPSNAEFVIADLTHGLHFEEASTDLVQSRCSKFLSGMY